MVKSKMTDKSALQKINELENGLMEKIFANTYQFKKEVGIIIDPNSGAVNGVIDFSGLKSKVEQVSNLMQLMELHTIVKENFFCYW